MNWKYALVSHILKNQKLDLHVGGATFGHRPKGFGHQAKRCEDPGPKMRTRNPEKSGDAKPSEEWQREPKRRVAKCGQAKDGVKPSEELRSEASWGDHAASCEGQADRMMTYEAGPSRQFVQLGSTK